MPGAHPPIGMWLCPPGLLPKPGNQSPRKGVPRGWVSPGLPGGAGTLRAPSLCPSCNPLWLGLSGSLGLLPGAVLSCLQTLGDIL